MEVFRVNTKTKCRACKKALSRKNAVNPKAEVLDLLCLKCSLCPINNLRFKARRLPTHPRKKESLIGQRELF
jgi:hypothetical protein